MLDTDRIRALLDRASLYGWEFVEEPKSSSCRRYLGSFDDNHATVTFSRDWVSLQLPLSAPGWEPWRWHEALLAITDTLYLGKAALAPDGVLSLRIELPAAYVDAIHFHAAVEALTRYRRLYGKGLEGGLSQLGPPQKMAVRRSPLPTSEIDRMLANLKRDGWSPSGDPLGNTWGLRYAGAYRRYAAYVTFTGEWVYLQSQLFHIENADHKKRQALSTLLLELNERMFWAKFGVHHALDEKSREVEIVALAVEMPANGVSMGMLRDAARTLAAYLERYYYELSILMLEPELVRLMLGGEVVASSSEAPPEGPMRFDDD